MECAQVNTDLCDGCGSCVEICCVEVITLVDGKATIAEGCILCMACAAVCPNDAITPPALPPRPVRVPHPLPVQTITIRADEPVLAKPVADPSATSDDRPNNGFERIGRWIDRLHHVQQAGEALGLLKGGDQHVDGDRERGPGRRQGRASGSGSGSGSGRGSGRGRGSGKGGGRGLGRGNGFGPCSGGRQR